MALVNVGMIISFYSAGVAMKKMVNLQQASQAATNFQSAAQSMSQLAETLKASEAEFAKIHSTYNTQDMAEKERIMNEYLKAAEANDTAKAEKLMKEYEKLSNYKE